MLNYRMANGSTVADWLGTAATAAKVGAAAVDLVRDGHRVGDGATDALREAEVYFLQALEELRAVRTHLAHVAAFNAGVAQATEGCEPVDCEHVERVGRAS